LLGYPTLLEKEELLGILNQNDVLASFRQFD